MTPVTIPPALTPKRAIVLNLHELEVIDRALADLAIDTYGHAEDTPGFHTARGKIGEALGACQLERRKVS